MINEAENPNNKHSTNRKSTSTNISGLFIRDFNGIREILRSIYLYGCYDKSDYIDREGVIKFKTGSSKGNLSRSKMEIEIARFQFLLGEDFFDAYDATYHCNYHLFSRSDDTLLAMYRNRTFTRLDLQSYIFLMQILNERDAETGILKEFEISDIFPRINKEHTKTVDRVDAYHTEEVSYGNTKPIFYEAAKSKLRAELTNLVEQGFLNEIDVSSHVHKYQLKEDALAHFDIQELRNLYRYLDFCGRSLPLQVPFYFAKKRIGLYLRGERNHYDDIENHMLFRHNFIHNGLDNEVLIQFLMAIREKRTVSITLYRKDFRNLEDQGHTETLQAIPVYVVHDLWTGKQHAIFYNLDKKTIESYRIDLIYTTTLSEYAFAHDWEIAQKEAEIVHETWRASLWSPYGEEKVKIQFHLKKSDNDYQRLVGEGVNDHGGTLKPLKEKDTYLFEYTAIDPEDMLTWIRSFGEKATILEPEHLAKRIHNTWSTSLQQMQDHRPLMKPEERTMNRSTMIKANQKADDVLFVKQENFTYEAMTRLINDKVHNDDIYIQEEELVQAVSDALHRPVRKGILSFDDEEHHYYGVFGTCDPDKNPKHAKNFIRIFKKVPVRLSTIEKEALVNAAHLPQASYFLDAKTIEKLKGIMHEDLRWTLSSILYKNRSDEAEKMNQELLQDVRLFERAIEKKQSVICDFKYQNKLYKQAIVYPIVMDYYAKRGSMRATIYSEDLDDILHIRFNDIRNVKENDTVKVLGERYNAWLEKQRTSATFEIIPIDYAIDRVLRLFSFYKKQITYNPYTELYTMHIVYFKEDYWVLQKDILSAGKYIRIIEDENLKNEILERTQKAKENYE